jgi:hypothetical protein
VANFRIVGTVGRKAGSGAPKKRTPEIVADVAARMEQSPKKPLRRLAQKMDLSYGTCHKILKQDLIFILIKLPSFMSYSHEIFLHE